MDSSGGIIFNGRVGEFTNGSTVAASAGGDFEAGNITFTANESLTFADFTTANETPIRPSGLFVSAVSGFNTPATGNSGAIIVNTPFLQLSGGARLDATTTSTGHGGSITITANTLSISGERPFPILEGNLFGSAGNLSSGIYSRSGCTGLCGNAGPISITSGSLSLNQGGRIDSGTGSAGRGGDIVLNATNISLAGTTIDGIGSGIFTTASGAGSGGQIFLTAAQKKNASLDPIVVTATYSASPGKTGRL